MEKLSTVLFIHPLIDKLCTGLKLNQRTTTITAVKYIGFCDQKATLNVSFKAEFEGW